MSVCIDAQINVLPAGTDPEHPDFKVTTTERTTPVPVHLSHVDDYEPSTSSSAPKPTDAPPKSEIHIPQSGEEWEAKAKSAEKKTKEAAGDVEKQAKQTGAKVEKKAEEVGAKAEKKAEQFGAAAKETAKDVEKKAKETGRDLEKKGQELKKKAQVGADVCHVRLRADQVGRIERGREQACAILGEDQGCRPSTRYFGWIDGCR